jgi:hypothetical protein
MKGRPAPELLILLQLTTDGDRHSRDRDHPSGDGDHPSRNSAQTGHLRPGIGGHVPTGTGGHLAPEYALALRPRDAKTGRWAIWWLDGHLPHGPLDPPVQGAFTNGTGTFLGETTATTAVRPCRWSMAGGFSPEILPVVFGRVVLDDIPLDLAG